MTPDSRLHKTDFYWLLGWFLLGLALRLLGLTSKPVWTDEFATIVFSLGNSFRTVPLDQTLTLTELLQPLQSNAQASIGDVIQRLYSESNHPPLYFVLTHLWLKLFPTVDGHVSVFGVRSLSALFGGLSIPATFGLSYLAFRSRAIAHITAGFTVLSPFGIYLAQEARHYTLPILFILASLACLVATLQRIAPHKPIPLWLCLSWVGVNALGIATHYFFMLTLAAEGLVLAIFLWKTAASLPKYWPPLVGVALGTLLSALVWLPWIAQRQDSELTRWIYQGDRNGLEWLTPIGQLLGSWITMVYLLPVQSSERTVAIASIVLILVFTLLTIPFLVRGFRRLATQPEQHFSVRVLAGFVAGAIASILAVTYITGNDLTVAFRYNFVYFPAILLLFGGAIAAARPFRLFPFVLLLAFIGSYTVVADLSYRKTHRPDEVELAMLNNQQAPALVAIAHKTHGQTGRLMGVALEWQRYADTLISDPMPEPRFLLAHQGEDPNAPIASVGRSLSNLPRPLDLWLLEFRHVSNEQLQATLNEQGCRQEIRKKQVDGYRYALYRCTHG